jgi:hypothetical protein
VRDIVIEDMELYHYGPNAIHLESHSSIVLASRVRSWDYELLLRTAGKQAATERVVLCTLSQ